MLFHSGEYLTSTKHNRMTVNMKLTVFLSLKVVLILANSADPDKMQHDAAFHLSLYGLPKEPFRDFQYINC